MNTAQFNQLEMLEYRAASALVAFEDRAKALLEKSEVRETLNFDVCKPVLKFFLASSCWSARHCGQSCCCCLNFIA